MANLCRRQGYHGTALRAIERALGHPTRKAFQAWGSKINRGPQRFGMASDAADRIATIAPSKFEGALVLARTCRGLEPMHRAEQALTLLVGPPK
jgi:TetR/AcrR family transcriptional repressor of lmrAB and yxaGH operons